MRSVFGLIALGFCLGLSPAPAAAASFDGKWFADIAPVQGCAGGGESTVMLTVTNGTLDGTLQNVGGSVHFTTILNPDGTGSVDIARTTGTVKFDGNHFTMDWRGTQGCARHADGLRTPVAQAAEYVALFSMLCLEAYPDENAVAALARQRGGALVTPDIVLRLLPIPGKTVTGWQIKTALGDYVVLESAGMETGLPNPNHLRTPACTLVTTGSAAMNPLPAFHVLKQQYAEHRGIALMPPLGGAPSGVMEAQMLGPASGIFMYSAVVKPDTAPQTEFRIEWRPPG